MMTIVSLADGIHLALGEFDVPQIVAYIVHAASMSIVICSGMIHAKVHRFERSLLWWLLFTLVWCLILFGSALESIIGINIEMGTAIVHHPALICFYGAAAGVLLRLQQYFHSHGAKARDTDRRDLLGGVIVFTIALAQAIVTSIFI